MENLFIHEAPGCDISKLETMACPKPRSRWLNIIFTSYMATSRPIGRRQSNTSLQQIVLVAMKLPSSSRRSSRSSMTASRSMVPSKPLPRPNATIVSQVQFTQQELALNAICRFMHNASRI